MLGEGLGQGMAGPLPQAALSASVSVANILPVPIYLHNRVPANQNSLNHNHIYDGGCNHNYDGGGNHKYDGAAIIIMIAVEIVIMTAAVIIIMMVAVAMVMIAAVIILTMPAVLVIIMECKAERGALTEAAQTHHLNIT